VIPNLMYVGFVGWRRAPVRCRSERLVIFLAHGEVLDQARKRLLVAHGKNCALVGEQNSHSNPPKPIIPGDHVEVADDLGEPTDRPGSRAARSHASASHPSGDRV
jgi:hypothetical protein